MQDWVREKQFQLRQTLWGKVRLRHSTPSLSLQATEIAFYELLLSQGLNLKPLEPYGCVLDVGCRNWSYARALRRFFPQADLIGIEVDGNRRYWNLFRRQDVAATYAQEERGRTLFKDFREVRSEDYTPKDSKPVLFTFFFPFVSEDPCRSWGLPKRFARFDELLSHAEKLASEWKVSFHILSAHQGEWEAEEAQENYDRRNLSFTKVSLPPNPGLWPSPHPTWIFQAGHDVVKR